MKKKIINAIVNVAMLTLIVLNINILGENEKTSIINESIYVNVNDSFAQTSIENENGIVCDCSILWFPGCKADHWGFRCAAPGTTDCSLSDDNCS